jgi:hypothetical protein
MTVEPTTKDKQITIDVPADRVAEFYAFYGRFLAGAPGRGRRGHGPRGHRCASHRDESTSGQAGTRVPADQPQPEPDRPPTAAA